MMWQQQVPPALQETAQKRAPDIETLLAAQPHLAALMAAAPAHFIRSVCFSDFIFEQLQRIAPHIHSAENSSLIDQPLPRSQLLAELENNLAAAESEEQMQKILRQFRNSHQVRIIWRDINAIASLQETLTDLTCIADTCIIAALNWCSRRLQQKYGKPIGKKSGTEQHLQIIAMGKLGAGELNLSSDIDLIFAYPESGDTDGANSLSNQEYFIKLGQGIITALDKITVDGFVFRVDMRLRPYGQSGSLVMNYNSLESYYHEQGREWERYAMIKARVVNGPTPASAQLMAILRPFTYRMYIDYSAFDSLRHLKNLIRQEVIRLNLSNNVKLGSGGIREVEFIVQAFQLIRGGQEKTLQEPNIFKVLAFLEGEAYLPQQACTELRSAYCFLRDVEHAIQGIRDEQSQMLPENPLHQARIAWRMGFADYPSFLSALNQHREKVAYHFAQIVAEDKNQQQQDSDHSLWQALWLRTLAADDSQQHPAYQSAIQPLLNNLWDNKVVHNLQEESRQRLDKFMPLLLAAIWRLETPLITLERILPLTEAILRRSAYMVLLVENPQAMTQLVKLCQASPWIANAITQAPILLDELLSPASLYQPPGKSEMANELHLRLLRVDENDLETQMDVLRHFRQVSMLQIAASDIAGVLPLMKVSDYLTWLAEVIVDQCYWLAWQQMVQKYGYPCNQAGEATAKPDFLILGYGKFGGLELSYGSDLDMVFVHGGDSMASTNGEKSIDNLTFYTRMGQRIIHILNTNTRAGMLYEVDLQLRPSGNSGLIVTSLTGFAKYQEESAWTWEHQALTRARVICGPEHLQQAFSEIREKILRRERDTDKLRQEVRDMRKKMRDNLGSQSVGKAELALKQDPGGIIDIEFMVQFELLAQSHQYPQLTQYTDNIRQLDGLGATGCFDAQTVQTLQEIYIAYRSLAHQRALQNQPLLLNPADITEELENQRHKVSQLWQQLIE
ncbi:MAG: bifunctional [glutamate--ammonia ligase]-adenylyl-L-tyrosine phosphorylase/[glutamate--ammonia-ligase] adenylyltransferase [Oceanospirillaceae bacterium]|nr:bifunctional [glutamate--ammonia ligase]-adenylyl-L-tyrosine phosphorylase/[glutamate--ammonia-ligase] adenylyltransferase [Oceanospirillaceae bacterium]MCP5350347.1 bifunctional [glutamate--ammonia ligase]-adenylyl-L-tyrosine phosphorylase/[glutamate--ammonia-ligase] adenylyltransferase [Oceanospirillaceae bacterium]